VQGPFPFVSNGVSMPLYFKKDKSHEVWGISQAGDELDSGQQFCINDILDEWSSFWEDCQLWYHQ